MSNLFARKAETTGPEAVHPHMVVEPVTYKGREMWAVRWYADSEPVRRYDSLVAAWDHACRVPFHESNTLPKIGASDWFESVHRGARKVTWTSDPRFAIAVDPGEMTDDERARSDAAVIRFVRHQLGEVGEMEAFHAMPGKNVSQQPETPLEIPDNPSDGVSGEDGTTTPPEKPEPVSEPHGSPDVVNDSGTNLHAVEGDSEPEPVHNFFDLAESAPSEQGRAYWREKWEALS